MYVCVHVPPGDRSSPPSPTSTFTQSIPDQRRLEANVRSWTIDTLSNNGCTTILPLVPHQGRANNSLPRRTPSDRATIFPPHILDFFALRRRAIRQRSKIQAQRPDRNYQKEKEGLHKLRHSRSAKCSAIQLGGRYAVCRPGAFFFTTMQCLT